MLFQIYLIFVKQCHEHIVGETTVVSLSSSMKPFEHWNRSSTFCCSETTLGERYRLESQQLAHYRLRQPIIQPTMKKYAEQSMMSVLPELPYFYSFWKTSELLPRLMTPCEHQVYAKLMKAFDQLCRQNNIEYMISHGTLLGSYRNHGKTSVSFFKSFSGTRLRQV